MPLKRKRERSSAGSSVPGPSVPAKAAPEEWAMPTKRGLQGFVAKERAGAGEPPQEQSCDAKEADEVRLFGHQRLIARLLGPATPYRGLLLYHGLGAGKTCAAIAAAATHDEAALIIVLLPASLEDSFAGEVLMCGPPELRDTRFKKWRRDGPAGAWRADPEAGTLFADLPDEAKAEVLAAARAGLGRRFRFVHYNGLNAAQVRAVTEMLKNQRCVVVVDEVHNFVGRAVNNPGSPCAKLHDALCRAPRVRVLALSGTPFINYPREIAYLANMIKGFDAVTRIEYEVRRPVGKDAVVNALMRMPEVDYVDSVDFNKKVTRLRMMPLGFVRGPTGGAVFDPERRGDFEQAAQVALSKVGLNVVAIRTTLQPVIPQDAKAFMDAFVDTGSGSFRNVDMLRDRLYGLASYYAYKDDALFPRVTEDRTVPCEMSAHQYSRYRAARGIEIEREEAAGKRAAMDAFDRPGQIYKTFSRMACNFAFPEGVTRPYPSTMKDQAEEVDEEPVEEGPAKDRAGTAKDRSAGSAGGLPSKKGGYPAAIAKALAKVLANGGRVLGSDLQKYSAKYAVAVDNVLRSPGPCLVYSQFRRVEGLRLFAEALKVRGYAELRVKVSKTEQALLVDEADATKPKFIMFAGDNSAEETRVLLDIFNGNAARLPPRIRDGLLAAAPAGDLRNLYGDVAKVLLVSQSGAEGISLRNTRQVHVLEPYWNTIRLNQVIGRAIRACSHAALPKEDRTVEVFRYHATLPRAAVGKDPKIADKDDDLSADQLVMRVAERKTRLMEVVLEALRATAVDCMLHADKHGAQACHDDGEEVQVGAPIYRFDLGLEEVQRLAPAPVKATKIERARRVVLGDKEYLLFTERKVLYSYALYKRGFLRPVGRLVPAVRNGVKGYRIQT